MPASIEACRIVLPFATVTGWPSMVSVTVSITCRSYQQLVSRTPPPTSMATRLHLRGPDVLDRRLDCAYSDRPSGTPRNAEARLPMVEVTRFRLVGLVEWAIAAGAVAALLGVGAVIYGDFRSVKPVVRVIAGAAAGPLV